MTGTAEPAARSPRTVQEQSWVHLRGTLAADGWEGVVQHSTERWSHTGLRIAVLADGESLTLPADPVERIIVPLSGGFTVHYRESGGESTAAERDVALTGRPSVFSGPSDVLYLGSGSSATVRGAGRFAVAESPTSQQRPTQLIARDQVPVELRGKGQASRQVHNFGVPGVLDAARLIVCEVITPGGNWSSYPPHKHDEHIDGVESELEEIYYFEVAAVRDDVGGDPFGLFSSYSSPAGEIDINAMVRTGDIVLVPHGFHGPAVAAPGYDLYYLNVMAGPGPERAWNITDDPHHAWVRESWNEQEMDPRLPFGAEKE